MIQDLDAHPAGSPRWRVGVGAAVVVCIAAVVIGAVITAFAPRGTTSTIPANDGLTPAVGPTSSVPTAIFVHVAGSVTRPGLYELAGGARVVDAIAAAGGFQDGADRNQPNLARLLVDGEQLYVPREGEQAQSTGVGGVSGRISINSADETGLDTLPRVGPALAARIVAWREAHGPFTSIDDLLSVPGIGEATLDGFRDDIVL